CQSSSRASRPSAGCPLLAPVSFPLLFSSAIAVSSTYSSTLITEQLLIPDDVMLSSSFVEHAALGFAFAVLSLFVLAFAIIAVVLVTITNNCWWNCGGCPP
ncbi:hypothetical protein ANCDUO_06792, partial [Ancylostoma duodenale]